MSILSDAASVQLLDSIFGNSTGVLYLAEANEGCACRYISPNAEKILGVSRDKLLSSPDIWQEHLHPEDLAALEKRLSGTLRIGRAVFEYRFRDLSGAYRRLKDEVELLRIGDASYLLGVWRQADDRNQELQSLRKQIHSLQSVIDNLPQRLLWKDRNSVFQGCNLAAARSVGLARTSDIVGKTDFDLHENKMDADYLRLHDEVVMESKQANYHADVPTKDSWLDVSKVPLRNDQGNVSGLLICYEDVGERKKNELALRKFRLAVEQSSSAILITDFEGVIEYANPRFVQLFGYSANELVGSSPRLLQSPDTSQSTYQQLWQAILSGKSWHGEFLNRTKSGEQYWMAASIAPIFDEKGEITHFLAIEDDITQRKQLEASLKQQLLFTKTLIDTLPYPVYFKGRDRRYQGCNRSFKELIGRKGEEFIGKMVFDVFPPELAEKLDRNDDELLMNPGKQSFEIKATDRDGISHDIIVHKATFADEKGEVAGIIGSVFDITEIRRIEEELRISEERFRTIANYTYNWENWIDSEGKLLWVNPAVERITGYTPEECYAMADYPAPLVHPEDWPTVSEHYAASLAGSGHRDLEFRIMRKDGAIRWAEVSVAQVYDSSGNNLGHRSSLRDVTDRRQAMDELYDTRSMLQLVLDHIPQGVFWKGLDGAYLGGNAIFARDLGLKSGEEAKGLTDFDFFPAAMAKKFRRHDREVLKKNKTRVPFEEEFVDNLGIRHSILITKAPMHNHQGKTFGLLGTYADQTELKQMDAELRESEAQLREITATAAEGIFVMGVDGIINFVNPEAERLVGWQASDLLGKPGHRMLHSPHQPGNPAIDSDAECCRILAVTREGKKVFSDEEVFYRKDGSSFNVAISASPIMRNGEFSGSVVAFHDISEQKLIQRHLKEALQELKTVNASLEQRVGEQTKLNLEKERLLIQQSRNAAMGEMISNIAHQWRQPLSTLGLVVQNILIDYQENQLSAENLKEYVETAEQNVARMSSTIDDFRSFFRPDKDKVIFSLHQAIVESVRLLDATLKNHNIRLTIGGDFKLQAFGHVNEFSQVILNLLANAKDALVEQKVHRGVIEVALESCDTMARVVIGDNAGGIPDEIMTRIFDPYFTTKPGGTGIGLYMSKTIIEKHMGGGISCRNTAAGAEFTVSIPLGCAT